MNGNISIVIGSWGSYNECNERALGSKWLDLSDYSDWDEIVEELKKEGFELDGIDEEQTLMHDAVYDLRTVPAIYLLDRNKRVLLKNAAPDEVGSWLSGR